MPAEEHDAQFRVLLAASTAAYNDKDAAALAADLGLADQAKEISARFNVPDNVKNVANDVALVLGKS